MTGTTTTTRAAPKTSTDVAIGSTRAHLPAAAQRLRLPLYARSQARMAQRWGFDLNAPDAIERSEALLAENPDEPERLLLAAAVRSSRADDAGALAAARHAVAGDELSARVHTTLATLLARSGDVDGAVVHAARAAELEPDDPVSVYNRGVTAWTAGDHRSARADFHRAGELLGMAPLPWWRRWWHSA
jgi:Flp pilus assembly protein TadD